MLQRGRRPFRREDGLIEQIGQRLRNEPALARLADEMPGPPDALQGPRDVARRFDLTDEIDRPHVDAEFERRRRHHRVAAGLPSAPARFGWRTSKATLPWWARTWMTFADSGEGEAPAEPLADVVWLLRRLGGSLALPTLAIPCFSGKAFVKLGGDPLDAAAIVGENDGRAMLANFLGKAAI